jgi:hypothetical protein
MASQMADIVAGIATASTEQAGGIEQVNKALTQMDEVTQQNSAMVEENAATARALEQQAGTMDERIGAYKLTSSDASGVVTPLYDRDARPKPARAVKPAVRAVVRKSGVAAAAVAKDEWEEF